MKEEETEEKPFDLLEERALRERYMASLKIVGSLNTREERLSLLAAVLWPRHPLLAVRKQ